jgi:pimeloyl-ACP methyl ester carboxylesterase
VSVTQQAVQELGEGAGYTPAAPDQDFTLPGLARFVADFCDALKLTGIDLVANDTGGAVSQVFAAGHAERLRTFTLTNCEAHDNVPPKALLPAVLLARMGLYVRLAPRLAAPVLPRRARRRAHRGATPPLGGASLAHLVSGSSLAGG